MGRHNHYRDKGFTRGTVSYRTIQPVVEALRKAGENVEVAAKAALKDGADLIVADAKRRCPVYDGTDVVKNGKTYHYMDKRKRPGELRDSIHATQTHDGAWYNISADAKVETRKGPLYYGAIVEFSPRINRPFLYPALDSNEIRVKKMIRDAVQRAVERGT